MPVAYCTQIDIQVKFTRKYITHTVILTMIHRCLYEIFNFIVISSYNIFALNIAAVETIHSNNFLKQLHYLNNGKLHLMQ